MFAMYKWSFLVTIGMLQDQNDTADTNSRTSRKTRTLEEIEFADFIRRFGKFHVVRNSVAARVIDSQQYPYAQKFRLYRIATNASKRALDEVSVLMQKLPNSYQLEITTSRGRADINRQSMRTIEGKDYESVSFNHYSQMLLDALSALKTFMPAQFHGMILEQLAPFLKTMVALSSFERAINPKPRLTQFTIPQGLLSG